MIEILARIGFVGHQEVAPRKTDVLHEDEIEGTLATAFRVPQPHVPGPGQRVWLHRQRDIPPQPFAGATPAQGRAA